MPAAEKRRALLTKHPAREIAPTPGWEHSIEIVVPDLKCPMVMETKMHRVTTPIFAVSMFIAATLPAFADNVQSADELRTSKVVGTRVYNDANENIGFVED